MSEPATRPGAIEPEDYLVAVPNWVRVGDSLALLLVALVLLGGFFSEGYASRPLLRGWAWAACGALGAWGIIGAALGRWSGPMRAPARWMAVLGLVGVLWTGFQAMPLPASFVVSKSPVWAQVAANFAEAGVPLPERIPFAHSPSRAPLAWNQLVACYLFFLGVAVLATRRTPAARLVLLVSLVAVAEGLLGLFAFTFAGAQRASGAAYNPNHHAALVLLSMPILLGGMLQMRRHLPAFSDGLLSGRNPLLFLLFLALLAGIGWAASLSRASLAIGIVILLAWGLVEVLGALHHGPDSSHVASRTNLAGTLVVLGFLGGFGLLTLHSVAVPEGFARRGLGGGDLEMAERRLEFWRASFEALAETPWLGLGPGGSEHALLRFVRVPTVTNPIHAHNDYVQVLAEVGAPAALVLAGLLVGVLVALARETRRRRELFDWHERRLQRACVVGLLTVLLHSAVEFPLRLPLVAFTALILLALVLNPGPILIAAFARRRT